MLKEILVFATVVICAVAGCTVKDPLFCDDTHPCLNPSLWYCDRTGDYEAQHIRNTCVASPFDAAPEGPQPDAMPNPAHLKISEDTHDFHGVPTGTESFPSQLVVTNDGDLPSGPITVSIGGANMGSFLIVPTGDNSDCAGQQLGAGLTCIVQVKYHAGVAGPESGVLHVDADPGGMPIVGLSGNSLIPGSLEVTAGDTLDFNSFPIGSMSGSKTITLHNKGGVTLTTLAVVLNDTTNFTKTSTTCAATLAGGASCDIAIRFNPTTVGTHPSSVTITSDQGAVAPQIQGVGTGDVIVTKTGTGTVTDTLSTPLITCGVTCSGTYDQTPITLHATTSGGIPFNTWGGACAAAGANADCTLPLTLPTTNVTAKFGVCVPGTGVCTNGMLSTCDATGKYGTPTTCTLGCFDGTRCYDVDPTNGLAAALDDARSQPSFTLTDGAQFNTDSGNVIDGDGTPRSIPSVIVTQSNGRSIRVFEVGSLSLGATAVLGANALGVASDGDVAITGPLRLAGSTVAGAGGETTECTNGPGGDGNFGLKVGSRYGGGGGGGFYGQGGRGGNNPTAAGGAVSATDSNKTLHPLRGGCQGGFTQLFGVPGAGGGAVQIVSRSLIKLTGNGSINTGGGGAPGTNNGNGGGGGGSGGGILLEAPTVVVVGASAGLGAAGGGGAGACASGDGEAGQISLTQAKGGVCSGLATSGGAGSSQSQTASSGVDFAVGVDNGKAGGGGGGAGVIRVNSKNGTGFSTSGGAIITGGLYTGSLVIR